jgi:hypothetical protein
MNYGCTQGRTNHQGFMWTRSYRREASLIVGSKRSHRLYKAVDRCISCRPAR